MTIRCGRCGPLGCSEVTLSSAAFGSPGWPRLLFALITMAWLPADVPAGRIEGRLRPLPFQAFLGALRSREVTPLGTNLGVTFRRKARRTSHDLGGRGSCRRSRRYEHGRSQRFRAAGAPSPPDVTPATPETPSSPTSVTILSTCSESGAPGAGDGPREGRVAAPTGAAIHRARPGRAGDRASRLPELQRPSW